MHATLLRRRVMHAENEPTSAGMPQLLTTSFAEHSGIGFMSEAQPDHMHESSDDLRLTNAEFSSLNKAMAELARKLADDAS